MGITINISIGIKDYEFYYVPEKVAKAIITLLNECENEDSTICSAESERQKMGMSIDEAKEPTTKNDLGVEKIVDVLGSYTDLDIPYKHKIAEDILNELPSVTPQEPRWIPVSERLPEIHQDVILSLRSLDIEVGFRAETEPYFYCHGVDGCYIEPQNVLAWQPLPEPYNAESEDKK